ncbi:TetR/AcrR family transcriptional regulator [Nonomuraea typhae]|uniref:TetR/AcrR family transcriptional regulator n=1 Tax=Nonomuraea typhae TaxID=2603600 RepID=UPI001C66DD39|nr:TetR/AcrR family transcriptional regulator [Nonomuraea typhae]
MSDTGGRTARSRAAILQTALDMCTEQSYAAVTMEAIATRARVGKPTLYRWWPSKGALMLDALRECLERRYGQPYFLIPDTGDLAADLRAWLHTMVEVFTDQQVRGLLAGVAGTAQHDPQLAAILKQEVYGPLSGHNRERIRRGQERGQGAGLDPHLLEDLLIAPLWYRLLVIDQPLGPDYADRVIDAVLRP